MLLKLLFELLSNLYFLALHVTSAGSFPPPLSEKKEAELLEKSMAGDRAAKDRLIEHNLRLVAHIVKKYYAGGCDPDDLISIGTIGLIKAVSTFRPDRNIRLATYAARCIENEILMYFRSLRKTAQDVSINDPIESDPGGNSLTLGDVLTDESDITEQLDTKLKLEKLRGLLPTQLDERERQVICLRFGLGGQKEQTQREIAKQLHISRSYVSRIEKAALEKLRRSL